MKNTILHTAILFGLLFLLVPQVTAQAPPKKETVALRKFVKEQDVYDAIDRWAKARSAYYSTLVGRPIKIIVAKKAANYLAKQYEGRAIPENLTKLSGVSIPIVVTQDITIVLGRSLSGEITARFGSIGQFLKEISEGTVKELILELKRILFAIQEEDCRIIACDPKMCDPHACAAASVWRIFRRR